MERTNALHCQPPEPVDLVTIDMAWTSQVLAVPAAANWLAPGGRIISLLKCHYEHAKLNPQPKGKSARRARPAKLTAEQAQQVCQAVCDQLADLGHPPEQIILSPILGKGGGMEYLLLISPGR